MTAFFMLKRLLMTYVPVICSLLNSLVTTKELSPFIFTFLRSSTSLSISILEILKGNPFKFILNVS